MSAQLRERYEAAVLSALDDGAWRTVGAIGRAVMGRRDYTGTIASLLLGLERRGLVEREGDWWTTFQPRWRRVSR